MYESPQTREECLECLCEAASRLGRLPKRSDMSEAAVVRIKGFFGPWPRALEAAGLKEPPPVPTIEKNRLKRRLKKRKANLERKEKKKEGKTS